MNSHKNCNYADRDKNGVVEYADHEFIAATCTYSANTQACYDKDVNKDLFIDQKDIDWCNDRCK